METVRSNSTMQMSLCLSSLYCRPLLISWSLALAECLTSPQWNQENDLWRNENECQVTWGQLWAQHYLFLHFFKFNSHHDDLSYWPNRLTIGEQKKHSHSNKKNISRHFWKNFVLKVSSMVYCIDLEISGTLDSESK